MKPRNIARSIKSPDQLGLFVVPKNELEYDSAVKLLGELMDEIGDNPKDRRYRLIETLTALIEAFDREHHAMPDVSGIAMLKFLMGSMSSRSVMFLNGQTARRFRNSARAAPAQH